MLLFSNIVQFGNIEFSNADILCIQYRHYHLNGYNFKI